MIKGLEELNKIKEINILYDIEMVESGEEYMKENEIDLSIIEKELKALEIIKNKEINIHALLLHLKRFDSPSGYNVLVGDKYKLTQEEYDLLKEVLL